MDKKCNICNNIYELNNNNFYHRKTSPDGFNTICITCVKTKKKRNIKHWKDNLLLCLGCNKYLLEINFNINNLNIHRNYKHRYCKECLSIYSLKRKDINRGKKDLNRLLLERWHGIKERSIRKGYDINYDWTLLLEIWNKQNGLCNISKIPMTYEFNNGRIYTNLSVDRIDSTKGYEKENIQLVCMAINQMKSDMSKEKLIYFCEKVIENR